MRTAMTTAVVRNGYGYDRRHRLSSLIKRTAAGALLLAMNYTVDASGLRTGVEETDASGIVRNVAYAYDATKRLISETIDHREDAKDRLSQWTYDAVGNRLSQTIAIAGASPQTSSYAYDANDRLLTESGAVSASYSYDAQGNTLGKQDASGATTYAYNDANRLIEAITPHAALAYAYTADGLRARQTVTAAAGSPITTQYVQDTAYPYAQVIEEYTAEGANPRQLAATFTFADELISQTRYDATGIPATTFVQADGFGSTRWLTDGTGQITDGIDFDAFGNEIARSGTTDLEHLYRGERWDANLAAYDLRARLYTPANGRFLTQDSFAGFASDPRSLHKYAYTHNDPVNGIDPSGHFGIISVGGLNINIGSSIAFLGTRAGMTAVAKFSAELAFEYATGIPVVTSPKGMLQAVRSLKSVGGDLASGAIKRLKAGRDFEGLVRDMWGLTKNTMCFKHGRPASPPGCFIPDFLVTKAGRLVEVKTSMGAVKKLQFQEFINIARESGQKMTMVFLKKPTPAEVQQLQHWALEVTGETDDMLLSIIHVLD